MQSTNIEDIANHIIKPSRQRRGRGRPRVIEDPQARRKELNAEYYQRTKDKFAQRRRDVALAYFRKKQAEQKAKGKSDYDSEELIEIQSTLDREMDEI